MLPWELRRVGLLLGQWETYPKTKSNVLNTTADVLARKNGQGWEKSMAWGYLIYCVVFFLASCEPKWWSRFSSAYKLMWKQEICCFVNENNGKIWPSYLKIHTELLLWKSFVSLWQPVFQSREQVLGYWCNLLLQHNKLAFIENVFRLENIYIKSF